jgi:hypothetical protein
VPARRAAAAARHLDQRERVGVRIVARHAQERHAQEWNMSSGTPPEFRRLSALLDSYCRKAGRDPAAVEHSIQFLPDAMQRGTADLVALAREFVAAGAFGGGRHAAPALGPGPLERPELARLLDDDGIALHRGRNRLQDIAGLLGDEDRDAGLAVAKPLGDAHDAGH